MAAKISDSSPPFNPYFALISGVLAVSTGAIFARLAEHRLLSWFYFNVDVTNLDFKLTKQI
jgi:hypothetical protein